MSDICLAGDNIPYKTGSHKGTVIAGNVSAPVYIEGRNAGAGVTGTVGVSPGAGGSALVEYSLSSAAEVKAGTAKWHPWSYGDVSSDTVGDLVAPVTALRLTATTANAAWEVLL